MMLCVVVHGCCQCPLFALEVLALVAEGAVVGGLAPSGGKCGGSSPVIATIASRASASRGLPLLSRPDLGGRTCALPRILHTALTLSVASRLESAATHLGRWGR